MPLPHRLFTAPAPPRVPKRGRDDGDNTRRPKRNSLPLFPPLPPLEGLSEADLETPGDGLAALMLLRQSWQRDTAGVWPPPKQAPSRGPPPASSSSSSSTPVLPFCPPLLLKTQVHSLVSDRSAVDREIDALRRRGAVRALRLPSSPSDVAFCFESDYRAALESLGGGGGGDEAGGGAGQSAAEEEEEAAAAAARALAAALPALPGASAVPAAELELLLLHAAHGRERATELKGNLKEVDALLAPLLRAGALAREHRGGEGGGKKFSSSTAASAAASAPLAAASAFVLSAPRAGPFVQALARGRVALERALRRKRYREAPEAAVIKLADEAARGGGGGGGGGGSGSGTTGLRGAAAVAAALLADDDDALLAKRAALLHRPALSGRFLVRDALGSGRLVRLKTTAGDMLRLSAERVG